jgi:hypothetical protein
MDRADAASHGTEWNGVLAAAAGPARPVAARTGPYRGRVSEHREPGPRPHKPALFADLTEMIDAAGGASPASRAEIAAATAAVLVRAGRSPGDGDRFVGLADRVGLDTLAALWRDADPATLPGALWALYLLRQWCRSSGEEVTRLWRAGEPLAPAEVAVAGVGDYADVAAVQRLADAVLTGVYQGDLAVAFERAAAFFRVVAAGRRSLGGPAQLAPDGADLAERNDRTATALAAAARGWRAGTLH